ncbi:hypothetical protein F5Y05DRAFT_420759 [Hypoxylon sp. FL0543]|nr:hypothetical protein F5Y05DRAFT_420759 [Hypoxylon sp. FL0543]
MYYDQRFTAKVPDHLENSGYRDLVKAILTTYGLKPSAMFVSLNRNPEREYNTFIWKVPLKRPALPSCFEHSRPYTTKPPPAGVWSVIVRIFNPKAFSVVNANRVQNEVASMHLIREGLAEDGKGLEKIIPDVYAWEPAVRSRRNIGWIMMETKPGIPGSHNYRKRGDWGRDVYIEQLAEIFRVIQNIKLPSTVTKSGGLTIDSHGDIVTGKAACFGGGPWATYTDFWLRHGGMRERLDTLLKKLDSIFSQSVAVSWHTLIHGGLAMENVLCDPNTKKITALLDFERACVAHPSLEFLLSFRDLGGNIADNRIPYKPMEEDLIDQIVFDSFEVLTLPQKTTGVIGQTAEFWEQAMAWDRALRDNGVTKPSMILGIQQIRLVARITASLWPQRLKDETLTGKQRSHIIKESWEKIDTCLRFLGIP